jgi:hypothetical protein
MEGLTGQRLRVWLCCSSLNKELRILVMEPDEQWHNVNKESFDGELEMNVWK